MRFFKKKKVIEREEGKPLLFRWTIFECRFFSIKIHKLVGSDHSCQHDHPWSFITFLLKGGYVEYTPADGQQKYLGMEHLAYDWSTDKVKLVPEVSRVISRFSLLYRPAYYTHRLEIHQPVTTLVITFKKVRIWGFFTQKGWVKWFDYDRKNSCE